MRVVPTLFLHSDTSDAADHRSAHSEKGTVSFRALILALAIAVGVGMAQPPSILAETVSFNGQRAYPVGANPKGLSVGDCDGDGISDLVTAAQNSNEVVILRNTGDGTLEFGGGKTNVSQPNGAACADFNGDGLIDIAAVSRLGDITLYFQDPQGAYNAGGTRPGGVAPTSLIAADLNGDGLKDLVAVDSTSENITILINTGSSTLPPFSRFPTTIQSPRAAAVADFDLDGFADIAVAGATAPYFVTLYGNGVGFATRAGTVPNPFTQDRRPTRGRGIAAADLNGDNYPDLAVLSSDGIVTLFLGTPTGQFVFFDAFSVSTDTEAIALSDLNGDGLVDLALLASDTNSAQVFLAIDSGKFDLPAVVSVSTVSNAFGPVVSRTVLSDPTDPLTSVTQLVAADGAGRAVTLVEQSDPTALSTSPLVALPDSPVALALGDVNGDTIPDAAVVTKAPRGRALQLRMLIGTGSGTYNEVSQQGQGTCGNGVLEVGEQCDDANTKKNDGCSKLCTVELGKLVPSLALTDLDADAKSDIVLVNDRGLVLGLMSDGQGRFREIRPLGTAKKKTPAAVADFTGDSTADVAFVSKKVKDGAITLLSNVGNGAFITIPLPVAVKVLGPVLAADFDRNGLPDLAVGFKNGWAVLYNDGTGPSRPAIVPLPKSFKSVAQMAAADFDEDGWLDLLTTFKSKKVSSLMFRGSATGAFTGGEPVGPAQPLADPFAVDLDQDDHQDIVSCTSVSGLSCRVFYGNGFGQFGAGALPSSSAVGREPRAAATGDFDQDGFADVVGISRDDDRAVVLFGGPQSATSRLELNTGSRPSDVEIIDLNNDGLLDFVVANEASRDLSIFLNITSRQFLASLPFKLPSLPNSGLGLIALASGDINGDGRMDLAAVQAGGQAGGTVTPLINTPGLLVVPESLPVGNLAWGIALGHLNADTVLDIVTANRSDNTFSVLLSQPGGGYLRTDHNSGGVRATDVAAADLNGDGFDDVIVTNEMIDALTNNYGNVATFLNDGNGGFTGPTVQHVRGREIPRSICAGDFDNDGAKDVAVASLGSNDIMVLFGAGTGAWRSDERLYPVGDGVLSVSCREADGDGKTDIAFGRRSGSEVGVILTNQ